MIKLARIKILLPNTAVLFGVIPHSTILIKIADNAIPLTTIVSNDNIKSMLISILLIVVDKPSVIEKNINAITAISTPLNSKRKSLSL